MLKFVSSNLKGEEFQILCNELEALEDLDIENIEEESTDDLDFIDFCKLEKLKKCNLELRFTNRTSPSILDRLSHMSLSVLSLNVSGIKVNMQQMGYNFPQLKRLALTSSKSSLNILNSIIQYFPKLESLFFYGFGTEDEYVFEEGITSNKLKNIELRFYNTRHFGFGELAKLFCSVKNLECIRFSGAYFDENFVNKTIQALEHNCPNLKLFECYNSCEDIIFSDEHYGARPLIDNITEILNDKFGNRFSTIIYEKKRWIMRVDE